ncbi:MAG: ACT domain-containing protein [Ilumatobacteraceae bacterium]
MFTYVVRVWVPDRPGALGQVASRIGAVRGDVVGIEILERGAGMAIDELVVTMPDGDLVDLLIAEIGQVDGTAVEEIRAVAPDRPDTSIVALQSAAQLIEVHPDKRLDRFCHELVELMEGTWSAALDLDAARSLVEVGIHEAVWLAAFIEGVVIRPPRPRGSGTPRRGLGAPASARHRGRGRSGRLGVSRP